MNNNTRILEIPNWCRIGRVVKVNYPDGRTGDRTAFYKEKIIGYSDRGFFTQERNCPVYEHRFDEWGKTVLETEQLSPYQLHWA